MQVLLKKEACGNLWKDYKENPSIELRNEIVLQYAWLVKSVARRVGSICGSYADIEDLSSFGMIGLIKAVEKFDTDKGVTFETYAAYRVRGEIIDYMRRNDWMPRGMRKKAHDIENAAQEFKSENKRDATDDELSQKLGIKKSEIEKTLKDSEKYNIISFEEVIQDTIKTDRSLWADETPENSLAEGELSKKLAEAIDALPERERLVISLYYHEELTLKEISAVIGVSESRVSQIHTKAVRNLKNALIDY